MQEIQELIDAMAPSEANVLITGESGVGKEVIANVIHSRSRRADKADGEAELRGLSAGDDRGGALRLREGRVHRRDERFSRHDRGSQRQHLFLDEISEMPADLQTRFLRVLQEREFRPLGSTKTLKADFRVVAATNRPIPQRARRESPPRRSLLPAEHLSDRDPAVARAEGRYPAAGRHVPASVLRSSWANPSRRSRRKLFRSCSITRWPGNVRELQNAMEYAVVLARQRPDQRERIAGGSAACRPPCSKRSATDATTAASQNLDDLERNAIIQALAQCHGNKKKAAEILGIQRPTLYNKMKRYAIEL